MMRRHTPRIALGWFLFGLGSQLQLWGTSLSFTELFALCATPLLLTRELPCMRRNGLMTFFWLSLFVVIGCAIACIANHTGMWAVIRGMAVTCLLPCMIVVGHWMLRRNMNGFKWYLVGAMFSNFLSTFIFQRAVEVGMLAGGEAGAEAVDAIMSGPIYWIGRLGSLLNLPAKGWYLQCPMIYCIGAPLFMAGFSMLTSASGRSAALGALASACLVLLGGKTRGTMRRVGRYFFPLMIVAVVGVFAAKNVYSYAALHDWLGEEARNKYEGQTKGNKGMMALLLGGRMDSFCGLIACVDHPIVGFGPWPIDRNGYVAEFLRRFGNAEDSERHFHNEQARLRKGLPYGGIPTHSYIVEFWCWYGIAGLIFWLYVLFVFARFLKQDCWAVPQWYMWLAAGIPGFCWSIFFSPWAERVGVILVVVACLMERAVRKGRQALPLAMVEEISASERR